MMNVLFVCDGNIARSPMAEALLRKMLLERGVVGVNVTSCGLSARPSGIADCRLSLVIGDANKFLENHHSRPLTEEAVRESDLILGMENRHVNVILERFPESKGKVDVITAYAGREREVKDYPANEQLNGRLDAPMLLDSAALLGNRSRPTSSIEGSHVADRP